MTYLWFLIIFQIAPILCLLAAVRRELRPRRGVAVAVLSALALAYTAPWDNFIIMQGVWTYRPARVLGATIGVVPIEEYAFYVLQVAFASLLCLVVLKARHGRPRAAGRTESGPAPGR